MFGASLTEQGNKSLNTSKTSLYLPLKIKVH